jgi:hypothetical protein
LKNYFGLFKEENKFYRSKTEFIFFLKVCLGLQNIINYYKTLSANVIEMHELFRGDIDPECFETDDQGILKILEENEKAFEEDSEESDSEIEDESNDEFFGGNEDESNVDNEFELIEDNADESIIADEDESDIGNEVELTEDNVDESNVVDEDESNTVNEDENNAASENQFNQDPLDPFMKPRKKRKISRWSIERRFVNTTPQRKKGKRIAKRNKFYK